VGGSVLGIPIPNSVGGRKGEKRVEGERRESAGKTLLWEPISFPLLQRKLKRGGGERDLGMREEDGGSPSLNPLSCTLIRRPLRKRASKRKGKK